MKINKRNLLQKILFNNSKESVIRQRNNPQIWDPVFFPLKKIKDSIYAIAMSSKNVSVIDIGCGDMPYRDFFLHDDNTYIGIDYYAEGEGILPIQIEEPFVHGKHDIVICSEVLEHTFDYPQVVDNIRNNVKEDGTIFVSVPFAYEVHGWDYNDYFRFTYQALNKIFEKEGLIFAPSNGYLSTILLKSSQLVFYTPIPYILKAPYFIVMNCLILLIENTISIFLKKNLPSSLLTKVWFSFPNTYYTDVQVNKK